MDRVHTREYLCAVCKANKIVENKIEHPMEGEVPDINTCDFSTYDPSFAIGGKLFVNKPEVRWEQTIFARAKQRLEYLKGTGPKPPIGGVCDRCLKDKRLKEVFDILKYVFAEN